MSFLVNNKTELNDSIARLRLARDTCWEYAGDARQEDDEEGLLFWVKQAQAWQAQINAALE